MGVEFNTYKPITLINVEVTILVKILAKRWELVLDILVSEIECAHDTS